ncbi:unnamed protein product [Prunus brigantina]
MVEESLLKAVKRVDSAMVKLADPLVGNLEESRLDRFRMKVAFAFVRPRLCRGTMMRDN